MATTKSPKAVVLFDELPPLSRDQLVEALTGIGRRHPAWRAVRQVLCDNLTGWHQSSLAPQNAGTPTQGHACGAQAGLVDALSDLDELMNEAVQKLEGEEVEP